MLSDDINLPRKIYKRWQEVYVAYMYHHYPQNVTFRDYHDSVPDDFFTTEQADLARIMYENGCQDSTFDELQRKAWEEEAVYMMEWHR